jgi:hypothetical protein
MSDYTYQEAQVDTRYIPLQGDKWRPEEDAKLMELAERSQSWKDISQELPGRSERSCYKHYRNYLLQELLDSQEAETIKELYSQYGCTSTFTSHIRKLVQV